MDGPMPKTVLIILAAVVALIVIVVLTGMRYLRADDDDFDDDGLGEQGHVRNRGTHPVAEQHAHRRARHDDEIPDERSKERVGAGRGARPGAGYGGERGSDRRGAPRSAHDRGWRDDSDEIARVVQTPRSGREPAPMRDHRPVRRGRSGHGEISEPMAASTRSGRSAPGRGGSRGQEEFDSQPIRVLASARGYERDTSPGRERRDDRDRLARREEADFSGRRGSRDHRDGRDVRDSRDG